MKLEKSSGWLHPLHPSIKVWPWVYRITHIPAATGMKSFVLRALGIMGSHGYCLSQQHALPRLDLPAPCVGKTKLLWSQGRDWEKKWINPVLSSSWHSQGFTRFEARTFIFVILNFHFWRPQHSPWNTGQERAEVLPFPWRISNSCGQGILFGINFSFFPWC